MAVQLRGRQPAGGGPRAGRLRVQGGVRRGQVHRVRKGVPRLPKGQSVGSAILVGLFRGFLIPSIQQPIQPHSRISVLAVPLQPGRHAERGVRRAVPLQGERRGRAVRPLQAR